MARALCEGCGFPAKTCLCAFVSSIENRVHFDVLQHPSEVHAAKNTARLCQLSLQNFRIFVGETPRDFAELQDELRQESRRVFVLYPDTLAQPLSRFSPLEDAAQCRVIVLDGTWKKAYKIWQLNPWLRDYSAVELADVESRYRIRKSPKPGGVSTLEAIEACINLLEPTLNTQPLAELFEVRQQHFDQFASQNRE